MNQGQPADEHRRQPQPTIKTTGTTFFKLLPRTSTYPHPPTKSTAKAKKVGKRLIGVIFQRRRSHQAPDAAHPSPCHIAVLPDRETDDFNLPHHPTKSTPKIKGQRGKAANTQRESGGEPEWSGFDTAAPQGEDGSATDAQHAFFQNSRQ